MRADQLPSIIQGGMGVAVSSWRLARAVCGEGALGVVSGTAVDTVLARRLQAGDPRGDLRRALAAFPAPAVAARILERYHRPGGKPPGERFRGPPPPAIAMTPESVELCVAGAFVEVFLAKEGHDGPVGINLLEKIRAPTLATLFGALLGGVDVVLMGAGIPIQIPAALDRLARREPAILRIPVASDGGDDLVEQVFDPRSLPFVDDSPLRRPLFLAIVSSPTVARTLLRRATGSVDGFVVEGHRAGGHNAPPRRDPAARDGSPAFGPRDEPDLGAVRALGRPFWLAGGGAAPGALRAARDAGAHGIQVGTAFALCDESGLLPALRREILARHDAGALTVRTDFAASPTGYPFKLAELPGTTAQPATLAARARVCDLGYLREPFRTQSGDVAYRCPGEPEAAYERKGGAPDACAGKQCLCNGLIAAVGLGQVRGAHVEPPTVTLGADLGFLDRLPQAARGGYAAQAVLRLLRS